MGGKFEQFYPEPSTLSPRYKWHVFISYRSDDRLWALKLYDALRHWKYEVFFDQFVLNAAAPLATSLNEGIEKSAGAILLWSRNYQSSNWTTGEYNAFEVRRRRTPDFRLAVATLDSTTPEGLLAGNLYVDFSGQPDGPCGLPFLELLLGLLDKPRPAAAVAVATKIDSDRKQYLALIAAARQNDQPDRIIELAKSEDVAWMDSPMLGSAAAEALIAAERFDAVDEVLARLRLEFPAAVRPRQLEALAARRRGNWERALEILGAMYVEGFRDSETMGMYAGSWWRRYRSSGNRLHLMRSRDLYREAFDADPTDSYNGANAASKSLFLGEIETSQQLASQVDALFSEKPPDGYWQLATSAEARLLLGDFAQARRRYQDAILRAPGETGSHARTFEQMQEILKALDAPLPDRQLVEEVFAHLKTSAMA